MIGQTFLSTLYIWRNVKVHALCPTIFFPFSHFVSLQWSKVGARIVERSEEPWHQPANLPRRIFFWLARQAKNDDSVLFINGQDTVIRVRATSCRVERLQSATDPIKTVTECCYRFAFAATVAKSSNGRSVRTILPFDSARRIKSW